MRSVERCGAYTWTLSVRHPTAHPNPLLVAWRMLRELAKREDWARDVIEEVFLDPEAEEWAHADES